MCKMVKTINFSLLDTDSKYNIVESFNESNMLEFCMQYGIRKLTLEKVLKQGKDTLSAIEYCTSISPVHTKFEYANKHYEGLEDFSKHWGADYDKVYWAFVTGMGLKEFIYPKQRN